MPSGGVDAGVCFLHSCARCQMLQTSMRCQGGLTHCLALLMLDMTNRHRLPMYALTWPGQPAGSREMGAPS
jgi:hypothetical protein